MSTKSFKQQHDAATRRAQAEKIRKTHEDKIPVIVERAPQADITTPNIDKKKLLVPGELSVEQFTYVIRKRIKLSAEQELLVFVEKEENGKRSWVVVETHQTMAAVDHDYKDEDQFLYITYSCAEQQVPSPWGAQTSLLPKPASIEQDWEYNIEQDWELTKQDLIELLSSCANNEVVTEVNVSNAIRMRRAFANQIEDALLTLEVNSEIETKVVQWKEIRRKREEEESNAAETGTTIAEEEEESEGSRDGSRESNAGESGTAIADEVEGETIIRVSSPGQLPPTPLCAAVKKGDDASSNSILLYAAARAGNDDAVKMLLGHNADPNKADPNNGVTPILFAVMENHVDVVKTLLDWKADPNLGTTDGDNFTPALVAYLRGQTELLGLLLEHDANPNQVGGPSRMPLLCLAAKSGSDDAVKMLLGHNADPNKADPNKGVTPILFAVMENHVDVAKTLLDWKADPNLGTTDGDYFTRNFTPAFDATLRGQTELLGLLLEHDANPNQVGGPSRMPLLCLAARAGNDDAVKMLLGHNADPNKADPNKGVPPILFAVMENHVTVLEMLLEHGANLNLPNQTTGKTPLEAVVHGHDFTSAGVLVSHGADPTTVASKGNNAVSLLYLAAEAGALDLVKAVLQCSYQVDPPTKSGRTDFDVTPIDIALYGKHFEVVQLLVAASASGSSLLGENALATLLMQRSPERSSGVDLSTISPDRVGYIAHIELRTRFGRPHIELRTRFGRRTKRAMLKELAKVANPHMVSEIKELLAEYEYYERMVRAVDYARELHAPLQPDVTAVLAAESVIFPLPKAVVRWLQGNPRNDEDAEAVSDARQATEWLIKAVQSAYLSARIKKAGRCLMACYIFTNNLGHFRMWGELLIPRLQSTLVAHGKEAKRVNAASNLAVDLNTSAVLAVATYNLELFPHGSATRRNVIRQDTLMPSATAAVSTDYDRDWRLQPEHIYIHVLLLIAISLNPLFGAALATRISDLDDVELHDAPIKSFPRMINKLLTADDHRYIEQKPRPAMNIDIVRCLVTAHSSKDILALVRQVADCFGGLSYMKCLPELADTDPAAADARYHMLPVMVTVVFAPSGLTVGDLLADSTVRAAWAALRAAQPSDTISLEQWQQDHDAAVRALETNCDPKEAVKMHCEVQIVTAATGESRHKMHEVYKVVRASDGKQLYADVAKPTEVWDGNRIDALLIASQFGQIATVQKLLAESDDAGLTNPVAINVNRQNGRGETAVYMAAKRNHFPVLNALLEHNADPNLAGNDELSESPAFRAAMDGYVEVLTLLLEYNADPHKHWGAGGATPLYAAASQGHLDIVRVLLRYGVNVNTVRVADGRTPVSIAAYYKHFDIVKLMLQHDANIDQGTTDDYGTTPLYVAARGGAVDVVNLLLECRANPNKARTDNGETAIHSATENGHVDIVKVLLENNANVNAAKCASSTTTQLEAAQEWHTQLTALVELFSILIADSGNMASLIDARIHEEAEMVSDFPRILDEQCDKHLKRFQRQADARRLLLDNESNNLSAAHAMLTQMLSEADVEINEARKAWRARAYITPLHIAVESDHKVMVQMLINAGAQVDGAGATDGPTPLCIAAEACDVGMVKMLINAGANVNHAGFSDSSGGESKAYTAAQTKREESVEMLELKAEMIREVFSEFLYWNDLHTLDNLHSIGTDMSCIASLSKVVDEMKAAKKPNVFTPLYLAASENFGLEIVRLLIEAGADVNSTKSADGQTALFIAAVTLARHEKMRQYDDHVFVALVQACMEVVHILIDSNADVNVARDVDGETPLLVAATAGSVDLARLLINANADVNSARTVDGAIALHVAMMGEHEEICQLLVEAGSDVNAVFTDVESGCRMTPLLLAITSEQFDMFTMLLEAGCDTNAAGGLGKPLGLANAERFTPLLLCAGKGASEEVVALLKYKADPNGTCSDGCTPLFVAAQEGHLNICTILADAGGGTGIALSSNGATDLWTACWQGHVDIVRYLIAKPDVAINRARSDSKTDVLVIDDGAAAAAGGGGNEEISGACESDDNDDDDDDDDDGGEKEVPHPGTTPLEVAQLEGHADIVDLLRKHGAV